MTLPHYIDPRTDGQRLFNCQYDFKNGNAAALGEMYELLYKVALKCINSACHKRDALAALAICEREQKAHDAATYLIEQYLKRPNFVITESITGYLFRRVQKELNYARACDRMLVYTDTLPEKPNQRPQYEYIVTDTESGNKKTYGTAAELYLEPEFRTLRKKRLAECVRTGRRWKNFKFELIEIN